MRASVLSERFAYTQSLMHPSLDLLERNPLFQALAIASKETLHTRKSLFQLNQQNKEASVGFINKLNNDTVFRLKVTEQYYLLSTLFKDPKKKARWLALLEAIEEREEAYKRRIRDAWTEYAMVKSAPAKTEHTVTKTQNSSFKWTYPSPNATEMEQWAHYETELQRITYNYHRDRAALHLAAYDVHLNHLDEVLEHLRLNDEENRELIEYLEEQRIRAEERNQDLIASVQIVHKQYDENCAALRADIRALLHEMHQRPEANIRKIIDIRQKYNLIDQNTDEQIQQLDQEFAQQKAVLVQHIETVKIKTITQQINRVDHALEHYEHAYKRVRISDAEKLVLEQSIAKLEQFKVELRNANDRPTVKRITQHINTELHTLDSILLLNRENPALDGIVRPPEVSQEEARAIAPPSAPDHPIEQQLPIDAEPPREESEARLQQAEPIDPAVSIAKQQQLRSLMQLARGVDPAIILIREIKIAVDKNLNQDDIEDEEKDLLTEIINKLHSYEDTEHVSKEELIELAQPLKEMHNINNLFNKFSDRLDSIVESMNYVLSPEK